MVLRIKPTPTRFPTSILYNPVENTPLHSLIDSAACVITNISPPESGSQTATSEGFVGVDNVLSAREYQSAGAASFVIVFFAAGKKVTMV